MKTKERAYVPLAKDRGKVKKQMIAATKNNPRVVLFTAAQVKKFWNVPQEWIDRFPVAMIVRGKPMYTEFLVDANLPCSVEDRASGEAVKIAIAYNLLGTVPQTPRKKPKARHSNFRSGEVDLSAPVSELALWSPRRHRWTRALKCLYRTGVRTIGDLVRRTAEDLQEVPYVGRKTVGEIQDALSKKGLRLRPCEPV